MNHNPHNLKPTDTVILDADYANSSEVIIVDFTPNKLFATVKSAEVEGGSWQVMTNRLSPKTTPDAKN